MGHRKWLDYRTCVPGPGSHNVKFKLIEKNEGAVVFKKSRPYIEKSFGPGPANYSLKEFQIKNLSFSFT